MKAALVARWVKRVKSNPMKFWWPFGLRYEYVLSPFLQTIEFFLRTQYSRPSEFRTTPFGLFPDVRTFQCQCFQPAFIAYILGDLDDFFPKIVKWPT